MSDADFWHMPRAWPGATVAILGGGPSLTQSQAYRVRDAGCRVIACNSAGADARPGVAVAPWADILYFCDLRWFNANETAISRFAGRVACLENLALKQRLPRLEFLRNVGTRGFSPDRFSVYTGRNSGYQAMQVAARHGAARILLLGFDMRFENDDPRGRGNYHAGHANEKPACTYRQMLECFPHLVRPLEALGVEVINCTPGSALEDFKRKTLADALSPRRMPNPRSAAVQA